MAAPTATVRTTPTGKFLGDGHSTKIAFSRNAGVNLWEKTVKPPGIDGGDPVDVTTMHNITWTTLNPRKLRTMTESTFTAAYDPVVYTEILSLVNAEGSVTVIFPDGSTLAFFGYLQKFEPNDNKEGEQPEATCTIACTNYDPTNDVEAGPVLASVAGT